MAQVAGVGGGAKAGYPIFPGGFTPQRYPGVAGPIDEEEERRLGALGRAADVAERQAATTRRPVFTDILGRSDEPTVTQFLITKAGGAAGYSQRVNYLANYWRQKFGTDPEPTFLLQLALLPLSIGEITTGILKGVKNYHRGLTNALQTTEVSRWQEAGVIPTGFPIGTRAQAIDAEQKARQEARLRQEYVGSYLGQMAKMATAPGAREGQTLEVRREAYWEAQRQQNYEIYAALVIGRRESSPYEPIYLPPGQRRLFTDIIVPDGMGRLMNFDVRMDEGSWLSGLAVARKPSGAGISMDLAVPRRYDKYITREEAQSLGISFQPGLPGKQYQRYSGLYYMSSQLPTARVIVDSREYAALTASREVEIKTLEAQAVKQKEVARLQKMLAAGTAGSYGAVGKVPGAVTLLLADGTDAGPLGMVGSGVLSLLNWLDEQANKYGWYVHGRFEYLMSARPASLEQSEGLQGYFPRGKGRMGRKRTPVGQWRLGVLVEAYKPDGTPLYVTAGSGMTEDELLKVFDIQGGKAYKDEAGHLIVEDFGPGKSWWNDKAARDGAKEYASWLASKKVDSAGQMFISGGLIDLGWIDPENENREWWDLKRLAGFAGDMFFLGIKDAGLGGGTRVASGAIGLTEKAQAAVKHMGLMQTMGRVIASETHPTRIAILTGISDEAVLDKLVKAGTESEVADLLSRTITEGYRIDTTQLLLKQQIKLALLESETYRKLPSILQRAFQIIPENPGRLPLHQTKRLESVRQVADAFNAPSDRYLYWSDKILMEPDRHAVAGMFAQMYDEFAGITAETPLGTKAFQRAQKRLKKYGKRNPYTHAMVVMAPDPETVAEISIRRTKDEIATLTKKFANIDEAINKLEQSEITIKKALDPDLIPEEQIAGIEKGLREYDEGIASLQKEMERKVAEYDLTNDKVIMERARKLRAEDTTHKMDRATLKLIHDLGGIFWPKDWDSKIPIGGRLSLLHGYYNNSGIGLLRLGPDPGEVERSARITGEVGASFGSQVDDLATSYADLALAHGAHMATNADELLDLLKDIQNRWKTGGPRLKDYWDAAKEDLQKELASVQPLIDRDRQEIADMLAQSEDAWDRIKRSKKAMWVDLTEEFPFAEAPEGSLAPSRRIERLERMKSIRRGLEAELKRMEEAGERNTPVPLWEYQIRQYWEPPVPLDMIAVETSGVVAKALDSIQRGVVVPRKAGLTVAPAAGAATGGAIAAAQAEAAGLNEEGFWGAVLASAVAGGYLSRRMTMKWAKHLPDPEKYMKITPNLDYLTSLWKRYALGSVGVLFRVAGDEPARMASRGYGWDAMEAWFPNSRIQKQMLKEGWYMGPYSDETGLTQLAYLFNNRFPHVFITFSPTDEGWEQAFRTSTKILQAQPQTKAMMEAFKAGEDPKIALARWYQYHPDTAAMMVEKRGTTLETLINQESEYFTKFTHRRVKDLDPLGELTDQQLAEWKAYRRGEILIPEGVITKPIDIPELASFRQYVPLEEETAIWHVSINAPAVKTTGLKPKAQTGLVGLGGGGPWRVSVTYSEQRARAIEQRMRFAAKAAHDDVTYDDILQEFYDWGNGTLNAEDANVALGLNLKDLDPDDWDRVAAAARETYSPAMSEGARKYGMVGDLDNYLGTGEFASEDWIRVGFVGTHKDMLKVDPEKIGIVKVGVKPGATAKHIPAEDELEYGVDDLIVLEQGAPGQVPAWFNPQIDQVLKDGPTGKLIHLRRNAHMYDFFRPIDEGGKPLTHANVKALPPEVRPYIQARRRKGSVFDADGTMIEVGKIRNVVEGAYDTLYGRFDSIMRNVRSNIYAREYKREVDALRKLYDLRTKPVEEGGLGLITTWDENMVHHLADQQAQRMVDFMTYTSQRTGLENLLRDVVPFMPATRDFLQFWAAESIVRPSRLAMFVRLNTQLPDEVRVQWDNDSLGGLGLVLSYLTASDEFSLNPRALSFFTGGATMPQSEGKEPLWQFTEALFPGFGPMITMPAHYFATEYPEQFGFFPSIFGLQNKELVNIPGLALIEKEIPLFSRAERFVWTAAALVGSLVTAPAHGGLPSAAGGYDFAQSIFANIPWLGRDAEVRNRMVNLTLQWVIAEEAEKGNTLRAKLDTAEKVNGAPLTDEQRQEIMLDYQKEMLHKAKARIVTREGATAFLGFVTPAIPYFRDREEQDVRQAVNDYKDTYSEWIAAVDGAQKEWDAPNNRHRYLRARKAQDDLRTRYPDYVPFFDYIDALAMDDEDKLAATGLDHPEVLSYFTRIYNNLGDVPAGLVDLKSLDAEGLPGWVLQRHLGMRPVKDPFAYMNELATTELRAMHFENARQAYKQFQEHMADFGFLPGDQEYETKLADLRDQIQTQTGMENPENAYHSLSWVTPAQLGVAPSDATKKAMDETAAALRAEYDAKAADMPSANARAILYREYERIFESRGLDKQMLRTGGREHLPADIRRQNDLMDDIRKNPWGMSEPEMQVKGITLTETLLTNISLYGDLQNDMKRIIEQFGGDFWDPKYDVIRTSYFEQIRAWADSDQGFAELWDYYQMQNWEKMAKTQRYVSPTWIKWFDALAQRDYLVDQVVESGVFHFNNLSSKVKPFGEGLLGLAEELKASDPAFAQEFDLIPLSFWDKERRW